MRGTVEISGSKNAALPIMAAALLTAEPCVIRRVPDLSDTRFMVEILKSLGAEVSFQNGTVTVHAKKIFETQKWIVEAVKADYSQRARILTARI